MGRRRGGPAVPRGRRGSHLGGGRPRARLRARARRRRAGPAGHLLRRRRAALRARRGRRARAARRLHHPELPRVRPRRDAVLLGQRPLGPERRARLPPLPGRRPRRAHRPPPPLPERLRRHRGRPLAVDRGELPARAQPDRPPDGRGRGDPAPGRHRPGRRRVHGDRRARVVLPARPDRSPRRRRHVGGRRRGPAGNGDRRADERRLRRPQPRPRSSRRTSAAGTSRSSTRSCAACRSTTPTAGRPTRDHLHAPLPRDRAVPAGPHRRARRRTRRSRPTHSSARSSASRA